MGNLQIYETKHILKQSVKKEITRQIRKYFDMTENDNTTYQNLSDPATVVLGGTFISTLKKISTNIYFKKEKDFEVIP